MREGSRIQRAYQPLHPQVVGWEGVEGCRQPTTNDVFLAGAVRPGQVTKPSLQAAHWFCSCGSAVGCGIDTAFRAVLVTHTPARPQECEVSSWGGAQPYGSVRFTLRCSRYRDRDFRRVPQNPHVGMGSGACLFGQEGCGRGEGGADGSIFLFNSH